VTAPAVVVKLGGSLAASVWLRPWLRAVAGAAGAAVVVPGGGPFADAVRAAQPTMGFDDRAADAMAKLAMAQYGIALASLAETLTVAASEAEIAEGLAQGRVPVWTPLPRAAADAPASWDVSSDSLALWLARRLGAGRVLLVKSRPPPAARAAALVAGGLLDAAFPGFLAAFEGEVFVTGAEDVPDRLDPAHPPGVRIGAG
jgi:aspartokinase-like uncharacterized kinase